MDAHPAALPREGGDPTLKGRETKDRRSVLVCDPNEMLDRDSWQALEDLGCDLIACRDGGNLLEEVIHRRPAAIVYAIRADATGDLALLQLVRRAAPDVALLPIVAEDSFEIRIRMLALRPIFYAVAPIDASELFEAVRAALAHSRPRPDPLGWFSATPLRLT